MRHTKRFQLDASPRPRGRRLVPLALLCSFLLVGLPAAAQEGDQGDDGGFVEASEQSVFAIDFVEISLFAGYFGGATFLSLPPVPEFTNDTGAEDILDFNGIPMVEGASSPYDHTIDAVRKELLGGPLLGISATFLLNERFGMELLGAYGRTEATITGRNLDHSLPDAQNPRYEWDRADASVLWAGANMVYNAGAKRVKPFLILGFGGILNRIGHQDDTGALYFMYGGGLRYSMTKNVILKLGLSSTLFTFGTSEVSRSETVQYPAITLGFTYRHIVPPPTMTTPEAPESATGEPSTP